ncbi:MAG: hypothetical protein N2746_06115 [Deltaproteobacteria bacterium]|nr:hypothetical protein [Deltaproteobacteria bacterium]
MKILILFAIFVSFVSCNGESHDSSDSVPTPDVLEDASFVEQIDAGDKDTGYLPPRTYYKIDKHSVIVKDTPYLEERVKFYYKEDQLPFLNTRKLIYADVLYAWSEGRLLVYNEGLDIFEEVKDVVTELVDIGDVKGSDFLIGKTLDKIVLFNKSTRKEIDVGTLIEDVRFFYGINSNYYFATANSVYKIKSDYSGFEKITDIAGIKGIVVDENLNIFVATDSGLFEYNGSILKKYTAENGELGDNLVSSLALCDDNKTLIIGTLSGYTIYKNGRFEKFYAKPDGLPMNRTNSVDCRGSTVALGHDIGATFIDQQTGHIDYYLSRRWILDEYVNDVALDKNGNRFVATKKGISKIYLVETTLSDKIRYFEDLQDKYYWRMDGFVAPDLTSSDEFEIKDPKLWDSDNDGLWTQMQIAAWCMAYEVTKDEYYYNKARKAIEVMFLEVDVPAVDFEKAGLGYGFVARSLVREDEGEVYEDKKNRPNWHLVEYKGKKYYWKDDTSSDEIDGHFFGYSFYYDHCAKDDKERAEVAKRLGGIADYILRNGYQLIDLDGQKTTWGHWQPDYIGVAVDGVERCLKKYPLDLCMESAHGGGWLNGTQILGFMLAAYRITGDIKFYNAYEELITKHKYDKLIEFTDDVWTVTRPAIANHSDHELAMLAYTILLRYEHNVERRKKWLNNLLKFYEWEIPERQPMWAAVVALYSEDGARVEDAIRTMREIPRDLRKVLVDNSNRQDAKDNGVDRFKKPQWDRVFPYDEIRTMWWNGNPYIKVYGGDPRYHGGPMFYSIAYWMLRYSGVLE